MSRLFPQHPYPEGTPDQTLAKVVDRFESAGVHIEFTPLETVADQVIEGIRADNFWMMGPPAPSDQVVSKKAASILARSAPDYLVDVLGKAAENASETEGGKR